MRMLGVLAVAASCGGAPAPIRNHEPDEVTIARVAVAGGLGVQIVRVTETRVIVERTVETPAIVSHLVWSGDTVAVWLEERFPNEDMVMPGTEPIKHTVHADEMGRITAAGYVPFSPIAWPDLHGGRALSPIQWSLFGHAGEIWQGYCAYGFSADGSEHCDQWTYARRSPEPVVFAREADRDGGSELATVRAPETVRVELATVERAHPYPDQQAFRVLRCTQHGATVQIPEKLVEESAFIGMGKVVWIASDPPMFRTAELADGFMVREEPEIHEGCLRSTRFRDVVAGPRGVVALIGDELGFVWRGRLVGQIDGGNEIAFAP